MHKFNLWNIIAPIVIILITAVVIQFSKGWRYDLTENTIIPTGIIDITSDPKGATIIIDGEKYGKSPKVIASIPEGSHLLELRKDAFTSWQMQVTVQSGKAIKIEANLFGAKTELEQHSETPLEYVVFSQNGSEAIIVSKHQDNQGIWKMQLKTSFFTVEKTKVKLANLFEPETFDLLQASNYQITPSPDFSKILLSVSTRGEGLTHRTFILDTNKTEITEITEYLYAAVYPTWSDDSKYLVYNLLDKSVYTLQVNNLQVSQIANWNGSTNWTTIPNQIYFISEHILTKEKTLFSANMDGTNKTETTTGTLVANDFKSLTSNPSYKSLIISTHDKTYTYDISEDKLEIIAEFELSPISLSPNQRFTLLIEEQNRNVYSYDHEFSKLALIIENYQLDAELLTWAPNDLNLFYRFTNEDNQNVVKSLDAGGNNKQDLLVLDNYATRLDDIIGLSADAKELYVPLLSNVTATNDNPEDTDEETVTKAEIILYRLKLR